MTPPWKKHIEAQPEPQSSMTEEERIADHKRRKREASARYREKNREKILAIQREKRQADPEKARARRRHDMAIWRERHPEKYIAKNVLRREAYAEEERAAARIRAREKRAKDPEAVREYDRQWRLKNLDRMREKGRLRYAKKKQTQE